MSKVKLEIDLGGLLSASEIDISIVFAGLFRIPS